MQLGYVSTDSKSNGQLYNPQSCLQSHENNTALRSSFLTIAQVPRERFLDGIATAWHVSHTSLLAMRGHSLQMKDPM